MTRNFEAMSEENHRLRESLDELRDSKVGVKQVRSLLIWYMKYEPSTRTVEL